MSEDSKSKRVNSYQDLIVWQRSIELVMEIYNLTMSFPNTETFGLTSQMRRAAVSIPSNIAEGRYRGSTKDFKYFLRIAYGSGAELETQLIIAQKLSLSTNKNFIKAESLLSEVMRMLHTMIVKFNN